MAAKFDFSSFLIADFDLKIITRVVRRTIMVMAKELKIIPFLEVFS